MQAQEALNEDSRDDRQAPKIGGDLNDSDLEN